MEEVSQRHRHSRPPELISFAFQGEDSIGVSLQSIDSGLAYARFSTVSLAVPKHGARISNETVLTISGIEPGSG